MRLKMKREGIETEGKRSNGGLIVRVVREGTKWREGRGKRVFFGHRKFRRGLGWLEGGSVKGSSFI